MAYIVDATATGPTGELRVLARRQWLVALTGELGELLDHDRAGRHVDPERESLGGEHDLHQRRREARLDDLLERRDHAGVMGGHALLEPGEPQPVIEYPKVVV